jgi:formylglycine-generating enzyme required for sulfatase activity
MQAVKATQATEREPRKPAWAVATQVVGVICIVLGLCYPWWKIWRDSERAAGVGEVQPKQRLRPAMILLLVGKFQMGSNDGSDEKPIHEVELTIPFAMAETEVMQSQYEAVMGKNPSYFGKEADSAERPVENVSWFDAIEYCNKLSEQEGVEHCYEVKGEEVQWKGPSCKGYRLPTEAEWEYAARADEGTEYAGSNKAEEVGWSGENSEVRTHPVKKKQPNQWGLYDLSGNVWEWVWDWYQDHYEVQGQKNPQGPPKPSGNVAARVVRGGGWSGAATGLRVASRSRNAPGDRNRYQGFRLVRSYP